MDKYKIDLRIVPDERSGLDGITKVIFMRGDITQCNKCHPMRHFTENPKCQHRHGARGKESTVRHTHEINIDILFSFLERKRKGVFPKC